MDARRSEKLFSLYHFCYSKFMKETSYTKRPCTSFQFIMFLLVVFQSYTNFMSEDTQTTVPIALLLPHPTLSHHKLREI